MKHYDEKLSGLLLRLLEICPRNILSYRQTPIQDLVKVTKHAFYLQRNFVSDVFGLHFLSECEKTCKSLVLPETSWVNFDGIVHSIRCHCVYTHRTGIDNVSWQHVLKTRDCFDLTIASDSKFAVALELFQFLSQSYKGVPLCA